MIPAPFRVVLDANVLFPFTVRDTLLRAAEQDLYLPGWTDGILEEMRRNLVARGHTREDQSHRLVATIAAAFPEARITGHDCLIPCMPNEPEDRHVAAAAVRSAAQLIVTGNLRHFRSLPDGIEARTAEDFLCDLHDLAPDRMAQVIADQAAALTRPPRTVDDILRAFDRLTPRFARLVRATRATQAGGLASG